MTNINISPVTREEAEAVLFAPEIYAREADGVPAPWSFCLLPEAFQGFAIYCGESLAGAFLVHDGGNLHFEALKPFRRYARIMMALCMRSWRGMLACQIPEIYPGTLNFAKNCGFVRIGYAPRSYVKNGKTCDRIILGAICPQ